MITNDIVFDKERDPNNLNIYAEEPGCLIMAECVSCGEYQPCFEEMCCDPFLDEVYDEQSDCGYWCIYCWDERKDQI